MGSSPPRAHARHAHPLGRRRLPVPSESARASPALSSTAEPSPFPKCQKRRLRIVSASPGTEGRAAAACLEEPSKVSPQMRGWQSILLKRSSLKIKRGYFDPAHGTLHHLERAARQMARVRQNLPFPAPATMLGASLHRVCSTPGAFQGLFEAREIGKQKGSAPLTGIRTGEGRLVADFSKSCRISALLLLRDEPPAGRCCSRQDTRSLLLPT